MKFSSNEACLIASEILKEKLICVGLYWAKPFEVKCDTSSTSLGVVLVKKQNKMFHLIYYASRSPNEEQLNYTVTE